MEWDRMVEERMMDVMVVGRGGWEEWMLVDIGKCGGNGWHGI